MRVTGNDVCQIWWQWKKLLPQHSSYYQFLAKLFVLLGTNKKHKRPKNKHFHVLEIILSSSSDNFSNVSCHNEEEPSHILILKGVYLDRFVKHVDFLSLIIIIRVYL